tara:strand:- start:1232 stop:1528 length:297 start_codon:yes stop_codon:yes gene_type:complete
MGTEHQIFAVIQRSQGPEQILPEIIMSFDQTPLDQIPIRSEITDRADQTFPAPQAVVAQAVLCEVRAAVLVLPEAEAVADAEAVVADKINSIFLINLL